ncbi:DUF1499 domain-containing protein [Calycomorphotria hydatis]|uniref:DUF1499 domain-containing protein n=1 Tax=Calycomorphotria hydatis TaxID=2528027 RepID=A0A517T7K1_9PLAN|nr:DUF1499 domain-containing protein [Calycomorphotria hydatis]QDT64354.1 hypothetical protein V22_15880 [Calycomorphotria hydatis]
MKTRAKRLLVLAPMVSLFFILGGITLLSLFSRKPDNLGVQADGKLRACPSSPNCVCSQVAVEDSHYVAPLLVQGEAETIQTRLKEALAKMPRTKITEETDRYLHVKFTTALMRYVDDVEFLIEPEAGLIHVRSASRLGYSDLGANRKRVEELRGLLD